MNSNKKSSRSKKTDGSNMPNFVFNFGGSQPGSPLASPGGFGSNSTPASPASGSFNFGASTSQPFVFGDPAAAAAAPVGSPVASAPFSFNSPQGGSSFNTKRFQSDVEPSVPEREVLRRAASDSNFSIPTSTPIKNGSFNFGANPVKSNLSSQVSFGSGEFSVASSSTTNANAFSIAALTPTTHTVADPGIVFASPANTSAESTSSKPFFFGSPAPAAAVSTTTSAPLFGSPAPSIADKPTTPAVTTSLTTSSAVPTASVPSTGFSFGAPADAPKITTTVFSFGTPTEAPKTTTPSLFSSVATSKPSSDTPATSAASAPSTTGFSFGAPKTAVSTPATTTSSTSAFSFGSSSAAATSIPIVSTTTTTTTTTTTVATTSAAAPTSSLFSLGTLTGDKDKKAATVTSTPFTFGGSTTAPTAAPSIPAVDPNKPNPFSFSKILDELAQTAAQPSNQVYASLILPGSTASQQNQIVSNTSFRIDNILSTTRFTELPEQAQKELDELEKYVRLEGQRCEYIGNYKVPQHLNAMDKAKKDTEALSQQLDALSSTLKGQAESIASLYENVKTQSRHANEGCSVIEACKHPGNSARWLFGYSEDDNYFSLLAKQLGGRLEEYKKCIWEIERTAESWSHNRVQSPQDIADIMRAQNQAFLALSNKVAALHESVNVELHYYNQYLKMYS